LPQAGNLAKYVQDEKRIVNKVPISQTPRFFGETKKPFETVSLHPARRLRNSAREEVKGGSHGD
jgi:hypothetical protein